VIGIVIALFCILAGLYCLIASKWYRAQTVIAPISQEGSSSVLGSLQSELGGLAALAGLDLQDGEQFKREALARLSSREFTYNFITEEGMLPILFADEWDVARATWIDDDPDSIPTLEDGFRLIQDEVRTVSEDRRTGLVKVTVDWKDAALAKRWANQLVVRINADMRSNASTQAEKNLEYLNKELAKTTVVELRQAINHLIESEVRKAMIANVHEEYAFRVIDPAFLPGPRNVVWPRLIVVIPGALICGAIIGLLLALRLESRSRQSSRQA
jgi:uncharacterized protein involved in exopolysaccharide biosynthesis